MRCIHATPDLLHALSDIQLNAGFSSLHLQPSGTFCNLWWRLAQMLIFVDLFKQFPFESVYVYCTISSRKWNRNALEEMHREQANRGTCQTGIWHDPWRCVRRYILAPKYDLYVFKISPQSNDKTQLHCRQLNVPFKSQSACTSVLKSQVSPWSVLWCWAVKYEKLKRVGRKGAQMRWYQPHGNG